MPFVVNPAWVFPPSVTHLRLYWCDWRLRRINRRRDEKSKRLEVIRRERIELDMQISLTNPLRCAHSNKLREEQLRLELELEPLNQSLDAVSHTRARYLTATFNK